jgi:NAD(P)-dependent dehydrogenase (short-subunit alcohol dehydrogenase family)
VAPLDGKTVVLTGASSGIGAAAARELAARGANVVPVGRDPKRLAAVARELRSANPSFDAEEAAIQADFASLAEVRRLAANLLERHSRIDVLVNNAGLVAGSRALTEDGYETTFAVNHLAPFLLTNLLLDRLKESAPSRVVTTSSDAHRSGEIDFDDLQGERRWSSWSAYSRSKLANILFTRALARRLEGSGVSVNALHPGVIRTRLGRRTALPIRLAWRAVSLFFKSPDTGATTIVHLASAPEGGEVSGGYFADSRERAPSRRAQDDEAAERLWSESARMVGL